MCATVVAGVDSPPVFEPAEHVRELVSVAVDVANGRDRHLAVGF